MFTQPLRRLPLQGAPNTRDLGGYPCEGGVTRWHSFLRSATTAPMTPEDIAFLRTYGVTTAVDLRSDEECGRSPSALHGLPGIESHHISLIDNLNSSSFEGDLPGSMAGMYTSLLDNSAADLARVCRVLAAAKGTALFHCTAGKDRTGVVAMLLLKLAGVPDADVEADYAVTEIYMREVSAQQLATLRRQRGDAAIPEYAFRSIPDSMRHTLAHLAARHGGARQYLLKAGVSAEELHTLHGKMVECL